MCSIIGKYRFIKRDDFYIRTELRRDEIMSMQSVYSDIFSAKLRIYRKGEDRNLEMTIDEFRTLRERGKALSIDQYSNSTWVKGK